MNKNLLENSNEHNYSLKFLIEAHNILRRLKLNKEAFGMFKRP